MRAEAGQLPAEGRAPDWEAYGSVRWDQVARSAFLAQSSSRGRGEERRTGPPLRGCLLGSCRCTIRRLPRLRSVFRVSVLANQGTSPGPAGRRNAVTAHGNIRESKHLASRSSDPVERSRAPDTAAYSKATHLARLPGAAAQAQHMVANVEAWLIILHGAASQAQRMAAYRNARSCPRARRRTRDSSREPARRSPGGRRRRPAA